MRRASSIKVVVFIIAAFAAIPPAALAQTPAPAPRTSLKLPPGISISATAGRSTIGERINGDMTTFGGSLEIGLHRFAVAQGEVLFGEYDYTRTWQGSTVRVNGVSGYTGDIVDQGHNKRLDLIGNLLGRVGAGRVHALVGIGFGVRRGAYRGTSARVGCIPWSGTACVGAGFTYTTDDAYFEFVQQFLAGVDVRLTDRLTAFGSFRGRTLPALDSSTVAGVRATVRREPVRVPFEAGVRSPESAIGEEVHVVVLDDSRETGVLLSMDATNIVIQQRQTKRTIPLKDVQGVRLVSHALKKYSLGGLAAGFGTGLVLGALLSEGDGRYVFEGGLIFGAIGAGAGALIGTSANLLGARNRTIYVGPAKTALSLMPAIGKDRVGFRGLISW